MSGGTSRPPPDVLLSWPIPNYIDPIKRGPTPVIIGSVCLVLLSICLPLRYYTRLRISKNFGLDDILLGIGVIFVLIFTGLTFHAYVAGLWDRHVWDVPLPKLSTSIKYTLVAQLIYLPASTFIKLTFLFLYRRILDHTIWKYYNRVLTGFIVLIILVPCFYMPLLIFQCRPIHAYWDLDPTYKFYCLPRVFSDASFSIVSAILDFVVVMLPIPTLWRMRLPRKQRIGLCCLFAAGLLTCVAGSLRSYYLFYVLYQTWDSTWWVMDVYITTMIEIYLGVFCASLPALRPLAGKYWPAARRLLPSHTNDVLPLNGSSDGSRQTSQAHASDLGSQNRHSRTISELEVAAGYRPVDGSGEVIEKTPHEYLVSQEGAALPSNKEVFCTSAL